MKLAGVILSSLLFTSLAHAGPRDCAKEFSGKFSSRPGKMWMKFRDSKVVYWAGARSNVFAMDVQYEESNLIKGYEGKDMCVSYTEVGTYVLLNSDTVVGNDVTYKRLPDINYLSRFDRLPKVFEKKLFSDYHHKIGKIEIIPTSESASKKEFILRPDYNKCEFNYLGQAVNCTEMGTIDLKVTITPYLKQGDITLFTVVGGDAWQGSYDNMFFKILYNTKTQKMHIMNSDVSDVLDVGYNLNSAAYQGKSTWKMELRR